MSFPFVGEFIVSGAVIGQVGTVNSGPTAQLYNPVGSGVILRCHRVLPSTANANTTSGLFLVNQRLSNSGGGTLTDFSTNSVWQDRSIAIAIKGQVLGTNFDNSLPGGPQVPQTSYLLGYDTFGDTFAEVLSVNDTYVLKEGWGLCYQCFTTGTGTLYHVSFVWEETVT